MFDILDLWNYRDAYFRNQSIERMKDIKDRTRARAGDEAVAEVVANDFALHHPGQE